MTSAVQLILLHIKRCICYGINLPIPGKLDCQVKPGNLSRFELVNWNLTKMAGYNLGCNLKIVLCLAGDYHVGT